MSRRVDLAGSATSIPPVGRVPGRQSQLSGCAAVHQGSSSSHELREQSREPPVAAARGAQRPRSRRTTRPSAPRCPPARSEPEAVAAAELLGTYERQPDGVDGCTPAYKRKGPKADKDEKFLWFHKQSTSWFVGRRRALCRGAGLISVLDPTKGAAAPEAVAATWKVWASEKAGWLSAPMLRCIPGSEARAELKKQNANAAQTVVLLGNTPHGVRHEFLGSYERWQEKKIHGRPAYVKVGDQRKMMWYSQNSVSWWVSASMAGRARRARRRG